MKTIDQWEQESIIKIQQTANEIRQEFKHVLSKNTNEMNEIFTQISQELNKARIENNFIENDIKLWLEKLYEFKKDFQTPKTIDMRQENQEFINKITLFQLSIDSFHQPVGDIQAINSNYTIIHGSFKGE
jgi:hypothetical protein